MALIQLNINRWGQGWCVLFQCGAGRFITTARDLSEAARVAINALALDKQAHTGRQDRRHCGSVSLCLSHHMPAPRGSATLLTETPRDMEREAARQDLAHSSRGKVTMWEGGLSLKVGSRTVPA